MLKQLPTISLGRNLTQSEWETVNAIDEAVAALHRGRTTNALSAWRAAELAHIRTVEEVNRNPRYREVLALIEADPRPDDAKALWQERRLLEHPIREAETAKKRAQDAFDDREVERTTQALGASFLAGEVNGFRLGLQVFATLMTQPDKWALTPGTPATAVVATLLTDLGYCSEVVSKLMAEPEANTNAVVPEAS